MADRLVTIRDSFVRGTCFPRDGKGRLPRLSLRPRQPSYRAPRWFSESTAHNANVLVIYLEWFGCNNRLVSGLARSTLGRCRNWSVVERRVARGDRGKPRKGALEARYGGMMFPSKWHFVFRLAEDFTDAWNTVNKNMFVWRNELDKFRRAKWPTTRVFLPKKRIDHEREWEPRIDKSKQSRGEIPGSVIESSFPRRVPCWLDAITTFYREIFQRLIDPIDQDGCERLFTLRTHVRRLSFID